MLVVHPSLPAAWVNELIALAKSQPGKIDYASGPIGASNHLAAEVFKSMAGIDLVRIKAESARLAKVLSGAGIRPDK